MKDSKKTYNVTYMFGAGASAKPVPRFGPLDANGRPVEEGLLPTVKDMPTRMERLSTRIKTNNKLPGSALEVFAIQLEEFAHMAKEYGTIDTYARKLHLNNERPKLWKLKTTLSGYFVYEQFFNESPEAKEKAPRIDIRYLALISAFLDRQNDQIILPTGINFISWNYDLQMELALQKFSLDNTFDLSHTLNMFGSFPFSVTSKARIVHLNGIAGLSDEDGHQLWSDSIKSSSPDDLLVELNPHLHKFYFDYTNEHDRTNHHPFKFSWDLDEKNLEARNRAKTILSQTNILVVIGYSFPVFNRKVDKELFSQIIQLDKVYYQILDPDPLFVSQAFNIEPKKVIPINNVDSFYIPPEMFNEKSSALNTFGGLE